jgi:hypothetical protein
VLYDNASPANAVATVYLQGTGNGPQVIFSSNNIQIELGSGFRSPEGGAVDASGNVFVADSSNNAVKEILAAGGYTTVNTLGSGFSAPTGVAVDGAGNVFVADNGNNAVKEILEAGGYATVNTLAVANGNFSRPFSVAVDGSGNLFVADKGNNAVKQIMAVGGYTTVNILGSGFTSPEGVAVDGSDNVFVADAGNNAVKEILAAGGYATVNTLAVANGNFNSPQGMSLDGGGNVFVADDGNNAVKEILAASGYITVNTLGSGFKEPAGVAVGVSGNVVVADFGNNAVKKLDFSDAPSLSFATTAVGNTSSDSPQTVTVANDGNAALTFSAFAYPADFPEASGNPNACTSSTSLTSGQACDLPISFSPKTGGSLSESLTLTDNNLNGTNVQQSITATGSATGAILATLTPPSGTLLASQPFTWNNGAGPVDYVLLLVTTGPGGSDLYNSEVTAATSATVSIPSKGVTVYGTLRQLIGGTWQVIRYTFTEPGAATPATLTPSSGALSTSQQFMWNNGAGAVDYVLLLGTTGPGSSDLYNSEVTTATSATVPIPSHGVTVYGTLRQLFNGTWQLSRYTFTEPGTATRATLTPSSGTLLASQPFTWNNGVEAVDYVLLLGTTGPGSSDLCNSEVTTATSATVPIPSNGVTVYGTLRQLIGGAWQVTRYTFTEPGATTPATLTPSSGALSTSQQFMWNNGSGATDYQVLLGTTAEGSSDIFNSGITTNTSATVSIPSYGDTLYGTLRQLIAGAWQVTRYTFTEPGATTPATLTPSSGALSTSQQFNWSNGEGPVDFVLLLGTTGQGTSDLYNSEVIKATSATVTIPSNGATVYATLRQFINATWQVNHYTFTEPTTPAN